MKKVIKLKLKAWLKSHIDMNIKLRRKVKNNFDDKWMNNVVFGKAMENMRKHRNTSDNKNEKKLFSFRIKL